MNHRQLESNTTYERNGILYQTDEYGRVVFFSGNLQLRVAPRNLSAQHNLPGKLPGEHAGHLIAARHGGIGETPNLVRMDGKINTRDYAAWERESDQLLREGKTVHIDGYLSYHEGSNRPEAIMTTRTVTDTTGNLLDREHASWSNYDISPMDDDEIQEWFDLADTYPNPGEEQEANHSIEASLDEITNTEVEDDAAEEIISGDLDDGMEF